MIKLFNSQGFNWQQMDLLPDSGREDIRVEKVNTLVGELTAADIATVNQVIKAHRLNEKETELLVELLHINYILEVSNGYN